MKLNGDIVDIFGVSCYKATKSTYCNQLHLHSDQ